MPRLPIDYTNAIIYKICCKDINITEIYIGSTTNFTKRKSCHKTACNNDKSKEYNKYKYQFIRQNGGWENFEMIEIEKIDNCKNGNELRFRERHHVELLKASLNKSVPNRTVTEYRKDNKDYYANYYVKYNQNEVNRLRINTNHRKNYQQKNMKIKII